MGLDIYINEGIMDESTCLYHCDITHNLTNMAEACGVYDAVWRPYRLLETYDSEDEEIVEERSVVKSKYLLPYIQNGLDEIKVSSPFYKNFNPSNGFGSYTLFVKFLEDYIEHLKLYPDGIIICDR